MPADLDKAVSRFTDTWIQYVCVGVALWYVGKFWVLLAAIGCGFCFNVSAKLVYHYWFEYQFRQLDRTIASALKEASEQLKEKGVLP